VSCDDTHQGGGGVLWRSAERARSSTLPRTQCAEAAEEESHPEKLQLLPEGGALELGGAGEQQQAHLLT
jgi:hypothetical protein